MLKYELKTVPNVSEAASIGGMVKLYQIVPDPDKLCVYGISHAKVTKAVQKANQEAGLADFGRLHRGLGAVLGGVGARGWGLTYNGFK